MSVWLRSSSLESCIIDLTCVCGQKENIWEENLNHWTLKTCQLGLWSTSHTQGLAFMLFKCVFFNEHEVCVYIGKSFKNHWKWFWTVSVGNWLRILRTNEMTLMWFHQLKEYSGLFSNLRVYERTGNVYSNGLIMEAWWTRKPEGCNRNLQQLRNIKAIFQ